MQETVTSNRRREEEEEGVSDCALHLEEPEIVRPQAARHLYHEVVRSQPLNRGGAVMMKGLWLIRAARLSSGREAGWFAADKCLWLSFALGRGRFLLDERLRPSAATSCQFSVLYGGCFVRNHRTESYLGDTARLCVIFCMKLEVPLTSLPAAQHRIGHGGSALLLRTSARTDVLSLTCFSFLFRSIPRLIFKTSATVTNPQTESKLTSGAGSPSLFFCPTPLGW